MRSSGAETVKSDFLPLTKEEMDRRGWDCADFVYVSGDAYVDHSSFGTAIIARLLESEGYRVAVIAQPDWKDPESIALFGKPRLGFLVSAGNMDSMVNHYTVNRKPRSVDSYSPGGAVGKRPDRAVTVYTNLIRRKYKKIPVIIGGIEASLRRLGHYDYWSDRLKRSVLLDSGADLLSYGMGEHSIREIAALLDKGVPIERITGVRGTVYKSRELPEDKKYLLLPSFDACLKDRRTYAESFRIRYENTDPFTAVALAESYGEHRYVIQNPPALPLSTEEMDRIYALPFRNTWHPVYDDAGGVPAIKEVKFSLTSNRGCFGSCSFCALAFHQGRIVQARSHESILAEAVRMTEDPEFKGYLHDVGGPTADFRFPSCEKQLRCGTCKNRQCLYPEPCGLLRADHRDYTALLKKLRMLPGVKKVFVRSGIRFDYVLFDKSDDFLKELCGYHISGQLRVAPEHVSDRVLKLMGKPDSSVYRKFCERFQRINKSCGTEKQYLVPYLISSHPGSKLEDAIALAEAVRDMGYMPEQVQDFYPTPFTLSTCMYYTGLDPRTMEPVYTAEDPAEKNMQRALIQYRKPENYHLVREALIRAGRTDLIGYDRKKCLIPPGRRKEKREGVSGKPKQPGKKQEAVGKKNGKRSKRKGDR